MDAPTITVAKDGGFFGHPQSDMGNVGPDYRSGMQMRIATGEIEEELPSATRKGGLKGGPARAKVLSPERRSEIAKMGAEARRRKTA